jgi:polyisoprenoid-binding protein YceI
MKRVLVSLAAVAMILGAAAGVSSAETYTADPVHSSVVFRIKHNNTAYFYGRVTAPEGTIAYDPAKPEATSFSFTLKAANFDTANAQRDTHIKSASFLNAAEYPTLTFKSTSVKKGEGDKLEVTGDITIHGVKKPLTVTVEKTGEGSNRGRPLIGFETEFTIKRSEFGVTEMMNALGDDVRIMVSFEAQRAAATP